jgi:hypothetical protein
VSYGRKIVNNELESVWKEAVMAYFKILYHYLHGWTEESHEKPPARIVDLWAQIRTRDLSNTN